VSREHIVSDGEIYSLASFGGDREAKRLFIENLSATIKERIMTEPRIKEKILNDYAIAIAEHAFVNGFVAAITEAARVAGEQRGVLVHCDYLPGMIMDIKSWPAWCEYEPSEEIKDYTK
jgi:hypothetical protein